MTKTIKRTNLSARDIVLCGLFAALIAVGAFIKIPFGTMPMTLQTLFVVLAGYILGSRLGLISVCVYIMVGLIGFPVFTQGGGISYVLQPTFGYLIGMAVAAFVIGLIIERGNRKLATYIVAGFIGLVIIYLIGMAYFYVIMNLYLGKGIPISTILVSCCAVFIPADGLSCILASLLAHRLSKLNLVTFRKANG